MSEELQRVIGQMLARLDSLEREAAKAEGRWTKLFLGALGFLSFVAGLYAKEKGLW